MPHYDDLARTPSPETEPPAPQDSPEYMRTGPGSWQPLGLVLQRTIGRLHVDDDQAA